MTRRPARLTRPFVCVKVDAEERPDLTTVHAVCQMLTGSGGWPLTIVMTPTSGRFSPRDIFSQVARWGRPGLLELAPLIGEAWGPREEVLRSADESSRLSQGRLRARAGPGDGLSETTLDEAFAELAADFDETRGGFGGAPKFPIPHHIDPLEILKRPRGQALAMAKDPGGHAARGIFDHLGSASTVTRPTPNARPSLRENALRPGPPGRVYAEAFAAREN